MRKIVKLLVCTTISMAILVTGSACSHSKAKIVDSTPAVAADQNKKDLIVELVWVKNKGKVMDMSVSLHNTYDHAVAFKKASWTLQYGEEKGAISKYGFSGEIESGKTEKAVVQFKFAKTLAPSGHAILTIDPIYEGVGSTAVVPAVKHEFDIAK